MRYEQTTKKIQYIRDVFAKMDDDLASVGNELNEKEYDMQIAPDEGKMLQILVKLIGAKKIIEVGSLAGYSAIWMAKALPEDGKLYALEKNSKRIPIIEKNAKKCNISDKIEILQGDALESLSKIEKDGPFDLIFIDADKAGYCKYLDWAEKNIRKKGLIIGDNTFLFDYVIYDECPEKADEKSYIAMRQFNQRLANEQKYSSILLPTIEGMTIAIKEF